jgi:hypothetical protein
VATVATSEGEETGYLIQETVASIIHAVLQLEVFNSFNTTRNAVDHKLSSSSLDFVAILHNFLEYISDNLLSLKFLFVKPVHWIAAKSSTDDNWSFETQRMNFTIFEHSFSTHQRARCLSVTKSTNYGCWQKSVFKCTLRGKCRVTIF